MRGLARESKVFIAIVTIIITVFLFVNFADAKVIKVKTYYKPSSGKIINSYYKTSPNKTKVDNFSAKGNINPFTGKKGKVKIY
jgi:hypothetical protein